MRTHVQAAVHVRAHTKKEMYSRARRSVASNKLPSHSIWFVISFSALIISQYLGHSPLIVSRVLRSVLLSHPDGWVRRPQSEAPRERRGELRAPDELQWHRSKSPPVQKTRRGRTLNGCGYEGKFYLTRQDKLSKVRINAITLMCGPGNGKVRR